MIVILYLAAFGNICKIHPAEIIDKDKNIKSGDHVLVDFTCRLNDESIVMTTNPDLALNNKTVKSNIFLPLKEYVPVPLIAGSGKRGPDYGKLKTLENEVLENLTLFVVGMKEGISQSFDIKAIDTPDLTEEERFIRLSRIRKSQKKVRVHPTAFKNAHGKDPVPGDIITKKEFPGVAMHVITVSDNEVEILLHADEGTVVDLPTGRGIVRDAGDYYETVIDIHKGQIIRTGVIVGRVVDVDEKMYTLDYGHPFGGEPLKCEITAYKDEANE